MVIFSRDSLCRWFNLGARSSSQRNQKMVIMRYLKSIFLFMLLISVLFLFRVCFKNNFNSKVRILNDYCDLSGYYLKGLWYPLKKVPYKEVLSEYPQLATCLFALPHILLSFAYGSDYHKREYYLVFSAIMVIFLFATVMILYSLRNRNKYFAFLMFLPASLYFSYNRYDVFPAFLSILSIKLLSKEKYGLAVFVLALGVLAKWYCILLLPIFLNFYYSRYKKINLGMIYLFCLTIFLGILPTLLSGGIKAFLVPYRFHMMRGCNQESLLYLLGLTLNSKLWFYIFFVLQFLILPFSAISKIYSLQKVVSWAALSIFVFMLFNKFFSPQWILWVLPFLILRAQNRKDVFLIVLFDLITYLYFPVIYDGFRFLLVPICAIKTVIILYFIVTLFKEVVPDIDIKNSILKKGNAPPVSKGYLS